MKIPSYLVSAPIPWKTEEKFDPNLFAKIINKLKGQNCDGIYIFGTSGEGYAPSDEEFSEVVAHFATLISDFNGYAQVGCFGTSSSQVKWRCKVCLDHGFDQIQVTLPFWKGLNDEELVNYFTDICGSFSAMKFLLYNNPRNKRRLKGVELERIHQSCPNLVAAKTGSGNWMDNYELLKNSPSINHFLTETAFPFGFSVRKVGFIPSYHYVFPRRSRLFFDTVVSRDPNASNLHLEIMDFFFKTALPLLDKGYIDGAIDKFYARLGGMDIPLTLKSPYNSLSEKDQSWLSEEVAQFKQKYAITESLA